MAETPVIETRFFFVRHGETDWNRDGRLQGQRDLPLNGRGRNQADTVGRILGRLLKEKALDPQNLDFVASPLTRTRDTMERLRAAMGLDPRRYRLDDRLKEIAFGYWEGRTWREIKGCDPARVAARKRDKWNAVPPGGESYADLVVRIRPWLSGIEPDCIVVAHGGVARAILTMTTGLDPDVAPEVEIRQGRVLVVGQGRSHWAE